MKFKYENTTNYTLKQEIYWILRVKSFEYNISYHAQFLDEFGKISQNDHEDSNL
jgi:hypothetical protein